MERQPVSRRLSALRSCLGEENAGRRSEPVAIELSPPPPEIHVEVLTLVLQAVALCGEGGVAAVLS